MWTRVRHASPTGQSSFSIDIMENDCSHNSCKITPLPLYGPGRAWCIFYEISSLACVGLRLWALTCVSTSDNTTQWADSVLTHHLQKSKNIWLADLPVQITTHKRLPQKIISRQDCHKHDKQISRHWLRKRRGVMSHLDRVFVLHTFFTSW